MTDTTPLSASYYPGYVVSGIINALVGVVELLLAVRVVLEVLGANASSQFVAWLYSITTTLMGPFARAFSNLYLGNSALIDFNAILAMIVYAFLGWVIIRVLSFIFA